QDHQRGTLVGTKTFGTGTVLRPFELSDGSAILLAVTEWLTPNGRQIWHQGIKPDIEVVLPENATILLPEAEKEQTPGTFAKSDDLPLRKAVEVLQKEMKRDKLAPATAGSR